MSINWKLISLLIVLLMSTSCGYVVRESGFVQTDWPKNSYNTPHELELSNNPRIQVGSSCDGANYTATFGPYIALPLFIIPNPFWPFTYYHHNAKDAIIKLSISFPTTILDWNSVSIKLLLNGKQLEVDHLDEMTKPTEQNRNYIFRSGLPCKAFDDSELKVHIEGPQQMTMERHILYKHRWRIDFDGI